MRQSQIPSNQRESMRQKYGFELQKEFDFSAPESTGHFVGAELPAHLLSERARQFRQIYIYDNELGVEKARALVEGDLHSLQTAVAEKVLPDEQQLEAAERLKWLSAELLDVEKLGWVFLAERVRVEVMLSAGEAKRGAAAAALLETDSEVAKSALFFSALNDSSLTVRAEAARHFILEERPIYLDELVQLALSEENGTVLLSLWARIADYDNEASRQAIKSCALSHPNSVIRMCAHSFVRNHFSGKFTAAASIL